LCRSLATGYNGHRFPVLVGEVGSAFETAADKQWLQDFADFMNAEVCAEGDGGEGLS
jgi:hypothetical protein